MATIAHKNARRSHLTFPYASINQIRFRG